MNTFNTSDLVGSNHFTTEEAKKIGESLGVDWSKFDVEQFRMGLDVELEHGISDLLIFVEWSSFLSPSHVYKS